MTKTDNVYYIVKSVSVQNLASDSQVSDSPQAQIQGKENGKIDGAKNPDNKFFTYKSKARPLAYLSKIAKFAGAEVVEGDALGDTLVYSASDEIKERLETILLLIDTPAKAITIRAALIEFTDSSDKTQSIALSVLTSTLGNSVSGTYKAGGALTNSLTFAGASVQGALSALSGDSRFTYLSQPMLRVLDGQTAKLSVGSDVPVRGAVTTDKLGNAIQSVDYHSSGVILSVTPKITGEIITINVDQQISSFGATTTSNIDSPSLFKRQASTTVDIKQGQLLVLAGLDEDRETVTHTGLSFLPKWMWSDSKTKSKSQVLLLLEVLGDGV
jgi:type II secretory pathway component GspD/PulD (secretin)